MTMPTPEKTLINALKTFRDNGLKIRDLLCGDQAEKACKFDNDPLFLICLDKEQELHDAIDKLIPARGSNRRISNFKEDLAAGLSHIMSANSEHFETLDEAMAEVEERSEEAFAQSVRKLHTERREMQPHLIEIKQMVDIPAETRARAIGDQETEAADHGSPRDTNRDGPGSDEMLRGAILALQDTLASLGGAGSGGGGGRNPKRRDFARDLSRQVAAATNIPLNANLTDRKARRQTADRLIAGLSRRIGERPEGEGTRYFYDPEAAGRAGGGDTSQLNGAQAMVSEAIGAARKSTLATLDRIIPVTLVSSELNIDEVRTAIRDGFETLENDIANPDGVDTEGARALLGRLGADIYDFLVLRGIPHTDLSEISDFLRGGNDRPRCATTVVPDCEVSVLTKDVNTQGIALVATQLRSIEAVLEPLGESTSNGVLAQLQTVVRAIPASAQGAAAALRAVELSDAEQAVMFVSRGDGSTLSVSSLLRRIEEDASHCLTELREIETVGRRDLERYGDRFKRHRDALDQILNAPLPQVPNNRFAPGRREMSELLWLIDMAVARIVRLSPDGFDAQNHERTAA
jgi:hypothetical protein